MRFPAVAGAFYTASPTALKDEIKRYLSEAAKEVKPEERVAIVCPHAGYQYSGKCAAYSYAACSNWSARELTAIIIGPNHTGVGTPISVSFDDWKTPIGTVLCDSELAQAISEADKMARRDETAHLNEHSCEVQVPFLQVVAPQAKMIGICMGWQDIGAAETLGNAIFAAVVKLKRNAIVIASSDFTHYEPAEIAKKKDLPAIDFLLKLDEAGFEEVVEERALSICGHGPIAAALHYAKLCGANRCELLKYTNSGETTGDNKAVVAYAALAMSR
ncbi:MAG: MEMO1 family protein [Candidatus Micrarchaeota archaeon]|nr:MEMO1 family protein [Candidatus Micrarchaeota archaeon]